MIEQGRRKDVIVADADEVRGQILRGDKGREGQLQVGQVVVVAHVVTNVVGDEELVVGAEGLVEAHGFGGADDGVRAREVVVVDDGAGSLGNVGRDGRSDRADLPLGNDVAGVGGAALLAAHRAGGAGVKDLPLIDGGAIAGIGAQDRGGEIGGKVAIQVCRGGQREQLGIALGVFELLPCEEEEGLVAAVVEVRNPDRATEGAAVVLLVVGRCAVAGVGSVDGAVAIVEPGVGIEGGVAIDEEAGAMKEVGAGLGGVALDAAAGAAVLGGDAADEHLELAGGFNRWQDLVGEAVTEAFDLEAGAVEEDLTAKGLAA